MLHAIPASCKHGSMEVKALTYTTDWLLFPKENGTVMPIGLEAPSSRDGTICVGTFVLPRVKNSRYVTSVGSESNVRYIAPRRAAYA